MTTSLCKRLTDFVRNNEYKSVDEIMQRVSESFVIPADHIRYLTSNNCIYVQHAGITNIINVNQSKVASDDEF